MTKTTPLVLLALVNLFSLDTQASLFGPDKIQVNGKEYPGSVDLSDQFRFFTQTQTVGSCHIYAGVGLVEAACYRRTGKKLNISESYMFLRHLRASIMEEDNPKDYFEKTRGCATGFDGGRADKTCQRIIDGEGCMEDDFPDEDTFTDDLAEIPDKVLEEMRATADREQRRKILKQIRPEYCRYIDGQIRCHGDPSALVEGRNGPQLKVKDPDLLECLNHKKPLKVVKKEGSLDLMLELLNRKIPFGCTTRVSYPGTVGMHIMIITGYEYSSGNSHNLSFKARDSNSFYSFFSWDIPHCWWITYIE